MEISLSPVFLCQFPHFQMRRLLQHLDCQVGCLSTISRPKHRAHLITQPPLPERNIALLSLLGTLIPLCLPQLLQLGYLLQPQQIVRHTVAYLLNSIQKLKL